MHVNVQSEIEGSLKEGRVDWSGWWCLQAQMMTFLNLKHGRGICSLVISARVINSIDEATHAGDKVKMDSFFLLLLLLV